MSSRFDDYLREFDSYPKMMIYNFVLTHGGMSDCIKFFMFALEYCVDHKIRLYYLRNDIPIENYVFVKHAKMVLFENRILRSTVTIHTYAEMDSVIAMQGECYLVYPVTFYDGFSFDKISIEFSDVFAFSREAIDNSRRILPETLLRILPTGSTPYVSFHLRLGDKFLETDKSYVKCKGDKRPFDLVASIYEINRLIFMGESVVLFCDNQKYKNIILKKCPGLIVTSASIGHTSFENTTEEQVMDTVSEFYIMSRSSKIVALSYSGFSLTAARFNSVPVECVYEDAERSSESGCEALQNSLVAN